MNLLSKFSVVAIAVGSLSVTSTSHASIITIAPADLAADITIDFEGLDLCGAFLSACSFEGLLDLDGATIGERFAGQTLGSAAGFIGPFDTLTQNPSDPLTVLAGATGQNLGLSQDSGDGWADGWFIVGLGTDGLGIGGFGEGAVSLLFDSDLSGFGLTVGAGDGSGSVIFDFYRRDGSLLDRFLFGGGSGPAISFAFASDGNFKEIAGVSITNLEANGVVYDNFRLRTSGKNPEDDDVVSVPEPGTLALLGIGLLGMRLARRRKRV